MFLTRNYVSVRSEAVTALQGVDALHVVGGQREVEDVVVLGDVGFYAAALVVGVRLVLEHGGTDRRRLPCGGAAVGRYSRDRDAPAARPPRSRHC